MIEEEKIEPSRLRFWIILVLQVLAGVIGIISGWLAFIEAFGKNMCDNISTCYSVVIFLVGIIITLKIKILDQKDRKLDLIFFVLGGVLNLLFLGTAFYLDCSKNEKDSLLLLNGILWFDIIITIKNIIQVIIIYWKEHFKSKAKANNNEEELTFETGDLFEQYLAKDDALIKRALTDKSYKNVDHNLKDEDTNFELATYGDAVIKLCYSEILLDNVKELTVEKAKYESDKYLVEKVAEHYQLINLIKKDENDDKMPNDYNYGDARKKHNPHKYIATAIEAMIGAIYKEEKDLKPIIELLGSWSKF